MPPGLISFVIAQKTLSHPLCLEKKKKKMLQNHKLKIQLKFSHLLKEAFAQNLPADLWLQLRSCAFLTSVTAAACGGAFLLASSSQVTRVHSSPALAEAV